MRSHFQGLQWLGKEKPNFFQLSSQTVSIFSHFYWIFTASEYHWVFPWKCCRFPRNWSLAAMASCLSMISWTLFTFCDNALNPRTVGFRKLFTTICLLLFSKFWPFYLSKLQSIFHLFFFARSNYSPMLFQSSLHIIGYFIALSCHIPQNMICWEHTVQL